jgi:hypothetical protein
VCILIHTFYIINSIVPEKSITSSLLWDRFGIGVSGICAIHCLVVPVLVSVLPLWSFTGVIHDWLHPIFILFLLPVVYFSAKRSHYDRKITTVLITGFFLLLIGWLAGHFWLGLLFESITTLAGSILLIIGHWMNYRHHRNCTNHRHNHHPVATEDN